MAKQSSTTTASRPRVTVDDLKKLVVIHQKSNSAAEVAREMNWKIEKVRAQIARLRKAGVPLKQFTKKAALTTKDIKDLTSICGQ